MLFADFTPEGWATIIAALGVSIGNVIILILGYLKVQRIGVVADATHTLVNSNMGVALREKSIYARRVADLTKDPADQRLATEAERLLAEHESKQAKVDRGETTPLVLPGRNL